MSSEFYITPYREALQWAGQNLSDQTFKTFVMLMSHANDLGVCFPGYRRLVELTLHEVQRVSDEIRELMRLDVVRMLEAATQDKFGRWTPALYQINPQILRLRENKIDEAMALWNSVEQKLEQKVPVQNLPSNFDKNQNQNQNQNQQNQTEESNSSSSKQVPLENEMPNAGQIAAWQFQREAPQRIAQSGSAVRQPTQKPDVPPPAAGAPGKYREIVPVRGQLPMLHEEELAQIVSKKTHMTIRIARGLIATYDYQSVAAAFESEFVRFAEKPAGALRHLLEKQQICDETLNLDDIRRAGPSTEQLSEIEI